MAFNGSAKGLRNFFPAILGGLALAIVSCGGPPSRTENDSATGSVSARLVFPGKGGQAFDGVGAVDRLAGPSGEEWVRVAAVGALGAVAVTTVPFDNHASTLSGIPPGEYTIEFEALDAGGLILSARKVPGVMVVAGQNSPLGTVVTVPADGMLFFTVDGNLWAFDGTNYSNLNVNPYQYSRPVVYRGKLFFSCAVEGLSYQVCAFDGRNLSAPVFSVQGKSFGFDPQYMAVFKDRLYMEGTDNSRGTELWGFDGTAPFLVSDIHAGANSSSYPWNMTVYRGNLVFGAWDGTTSSLHRVPWVYDGVSAPSKVAVISTHNDFWYPVRFQGRLYFSGGRPEGDRELYYLDLSGEPVLAVDLYPGYNDTYHYYNSSTPEDLCVYDGELYFSAWGQWTGDELVSYDGVAPSYYDMNPGYNFTTGQRNSQAPYALIAFGDSLWYVPTYGPSRGQIWGLDSYSQPSRATSIVTSDADYFYVGFAVYNDSLVYAAHAASPDTNIKLWSFDGSSAIAMTPASGNGYGDVRPFAVYNPDYPPAADLSGSEWDLESTVVFDDCGSAAGSTADHYWTFTQRGNSLVIETRSEKLSELKTLNGVMVGNQVQYRRDGIEIGSFTGPMYVKVNLSASGDTLQGETVYIGRFLSQTCSRRSTLEGQRVF